MAETNETSWKDIIPERSVSMFFGGLRDLGIEGRDCILKEGTDKRQFNMVAVVSANEINDTNQIFIEDARSEFLKKSEETALGADGRYIKLSGLAIVMNISDSSGVYHHTEERILDPTGQLLKEIKKKHGETEPGLYPQTGLGQKDIVAELEKDFFERHDRNTEPIIVLFSHLIPCTDPQHRCAELIKTFAHETGKKLIVSYADLCRTTCTEEALQTLNSSPNIILVRPEDMRQTTNHQIET